MRSGRQEVRVLALAHVNVEVTDLRRALAFYHHLGLTEVPRAGTPNREGSWLRFADGRELHLSVAPAKSPSHAHFAVLVDDLLTARTVFEELGLAIEPARDLPGLQRFFVRDPDGNRIEIAQRDESATNGGG
jgi:catechol 2,3-dioxygenase-like lactoylglutathione lyase family enzyme